MRRIEHVLYLRRRVGEDFRVGVRRSSRCVTRVPEKIRGAPEQAQPGFIHPLSHALDDAIELIAALAKRRALGCHIPVVETKERNAELCEEFEGDVRLVLRLRHAIAALEPGTIEGALTEDVRPRPAEAVPVADRKTQMIFHPLSENDPVRLVVPEREIVRRIGAFVGNRVDVGEEGVCHRSFSGRTRAGAPK